MDFILFIRLQLSRIIYFSNYHAYPSIFCSKFIGFIIIEGHFSPQLISRQVGAELLESHQGLPIVAQGRSLAHDHARPCRP